MYAAEVGIYVGKLVTLQRFSAEGAHYVQPTTCVVIHTVLQYWLIAVFDYAPMALHCTRCHCDIPIPYCGILAIAWILHLSSHRSIFFYTCSRVCGKLWSIGFRITMCVCFCISPNYTEAPSHLMDGFERTYYM